MLLLIVQLSLHPIGLLLLLPLVLIPSHAIGYTIGGSKTNRVVELLYMPLQRSYLIFLIQNLRLPLFRRLLEFARHRGRMFITAPSRWGGLSAFRNLFVRDYFGRLGIIAGSGFRLILLLARLAGNVAERWRVLKECARGSQGNRGRKKHQPSSFAHSKALFGNAMRKGSFIRVTNGI